jgi:hypothetical protein
MESLKIILFENGLDVLSHTTLRGRSSSSLPLWVPDWTCRDAPDLIDDKRHSLLDSVHVKGERRMRCLRAVKMMRENLQSWKFMESSLDILQKNFTGPRVAEIPIPAPSKALGATLSSQHILHNHRTGFGSSLELRILSFSEHPMKAISLSRRQGLNTC